MIKEAVAKLLLEVKAVTLRPHDPFIYTSGMKSPIYCDNRLIMSYPEKRKRIVDYFLEMIKENKVDFDVVAGVATAGISHATLIADRLNKPMVYVRSEKKKHGKQNTVEGTLEKGQRALLVEDHISTGGSSVAALEALRKMATVEYCVAISTYEMKQAIDRFATAKCTLLTLTDFTTLTTAAIESGDLDEKDKEMVLAWRDDPEHWEHDN